MLYSPKSASAGRGRRASMLSRAEVLEFYELNSRAAVACANFSDGLA